MHCDFIHRKTWKQGLLQKRIHKIENNTFMYNQFWRMDKIYSTVYSLLIHFFFDIETFEQLDLRWKSIFYFSDTKLKKCVKWSCKFYMDILKSTQTNVWHENRVTHKLTHTRDYGDDASLIIVPQIWLLWEVHLSRRWKLEELAIRKIKNCFIKFVACFCTFRLQHLR